VSASDWAPCASQCRQTTARARIRLVDRPALDHFILCLLIVFLLVYVSELILLPCGSFGDLSSCDLPPASKRFWSTAATSSVILGVQLQHPHYTAPVMPALLMTNGPWIAGPLLVSSRLRHGRCLEAETTS